MPAPKYKKQYEEMLDYNKEVFEELNKTYLLYKESPKKYKDAFAEIQKKAFRIVRKNEDNLCSKSEATHFSVYSTGLSDKFWELVRSNYPEIDVTAE